MTSNKINRLASTVTTWITPPECQGQMVELSYGRSDEDGTVMVRELDRSGPDVRYGIVRTDDYQPQNGAPEGEVVWA